MTITETLHNVMVSCSMPIRKGLNLISLRGCRVEDGKILVVGNEVDRFNDTMFCVDFGKSKLAYYPCTAGEPGWYWINHSSYSGPDRGAPFTCPGQYLYVRGVHKSRNAMRQSPTDRGRLKVIRDLDGDGSPELSERVDRPLDTGINIHAAGHSNDNVGPASSGCHVIKGPWTGSNWKNFYSLIYGTYEDQTAFSYTVLPAAWAFDGYRRLLIGSASPFVAKLKGILKEKKYLDKVDSSFWHETDKAVIKWQLSNDQSPTGVVVNNTLWAKENIFTV